ncbi:MAG: alpha/beta hydrolase [Planctomycetes bacterium]|nr:alpha/beta hydrolase [Planctomycetota bacterium]
MSTYWPSRVWSNPWLRSAAFLALGYVGLVSMLLFLENLLVYQPTTAERHWQPPPADEGIQDVYVTSADGSHLHGWWCPAKGSDHALLYCHGNAGNLSHRGASIVKLRKILNASVLIIDYPGYGRSTGRPSEQGCYDAADAAYQWLTDEAKIAPRKIILYGGSLGGGVVTDVASRKEHRALVLIKTFASLPDAASHLYWWLPAPKKLLMRNQFNSIGKIGSIHRPVYIAHGTADSLIPYTQGVRLFEAANEPKRFFSMPGKDHNDSLPEEMFIDLKKFLAEHE